MPFACNTLAIVFADLLCVPHHLRTIQPFAQMNRAVLIHPNEVEHLFCAIASEYAHLLLHRTRLLLVPAFIRLLKALRLSKAVPHGGGSMLLI